jgi:general secretion pathway protein D
MAHPIYLRVASRRLWLGVCVLCCALFAARPTKMTAQDQVPADPTAGRHTVRAAEDAYFAGAKKLERNDLSGAEREFAHALQLDPGNREYAIAISVTREHRLTELVQQASKARLSGDSARADTLIAEARAIDPANPIVMEHSESALVKSAEMPQEPNPASRDAASAAGKGITPLTNRAQLLSAADAGETWRLPAPVLAGPLQLRPTDALKSFHLRGSTQDVLRDVAAAYGIRTVFDESVERKNLRFDLEDKTYAEAMAILMKMVHVFAVPIDATSVLIAKDDQTNRPRFDRLMEETIFLPGMSNEQINDLGNTVRNVFDVRQGMVQAGAQTIIVRAPEDTIGPLNRTIEDLIGSNSEVLLEVKLYEIDMTHMTNVGVTIPTQIGAYNVASAATSLVNANQALVQQAIAQGLISATASPLQIALALIGSGLVQSSQLAGTLGFFGHGLTLTGVTIPSLATLNLVLNSSDTRALDDVQFRMSDRQPGIFRAGTRYPITTSTYTTGLSTAASQLSNATINGVSVASLLSQFAGGSSATIPQISYEDLGVTLKATPVIQKSGRVNLTLDLKIEALAGGSANGIPVLGSRQFTSDITVGDGETAMLVSNMTRNESVAVTGIPGLSELPGFQVPLNKNGEKDTSQLVVLITPHVIRRRSNMIAGPQIRVRPDASATPVGLPNAR